MGHIPTHPFSEASPNLTQYPNPRHNPGEGRYVAHNRATSSIPVSITTKVSHILHFRLISGFVPLQHTFTDLLGSVQASVSQLQEYLGSLGALCINGTAILPFVVVLYEDCIAKLNSDNLVLNRISRVTNGYLGSLAAWTKKQISWWSRYLKVFYLCTYSFIHLLTGYWQLLDPDFRDRVMVRILTLLEEKGWSYDCVPGDECCEILSELEPR